MLTKSPMKHMAIIPARLASTRLPNKPLQMIGPEKNQKPLVVYVAHEVLKTQVFDKVVVATDAVEITELFKDEASVQVVMTDISHESGTDRINEAASQVEEGFDSIFNIQGDEPFVYGEDLNRLKKSIEAGAEMTSLYEPLSEAGLANPNQVKVLLNNEQEAIYFSRFGIPFSRESGELDSKYIGKHVGVYAYQKSFLENFCKEPLGFHEKYEKLEQLRALQMGAKIKMVLTENKYRGVDTKEDLEKVNRLLSDGKS